MPYYRFIPYGALKGKMSVATYRFATNGEVVDFIRQHLDAVGLHNHEIKFEPNTPEGAMSCLNLSVVANEDRIATIEMLTGEGGFPGPENSGWCWIEDHLEPVVVSFDSRGANRGEWIYACVDEYGDRTHRPVGYRLVQKLPDNPFFASK